MIDGDYTKNEENAYKKKPLGKMTLQDALIAIGVYAARVLELEEGETVERVAEQAGRHPLFEESAESLYARINHVTNQMGTEKPQAMLSRAARSLTSELRETGFKWAVAVTQAPAELAADKRALLEQLQTTLSISAERAEKIIQGQDHGE